MGANTKLVKSLAHIILSLSEDERNLLESQLQKQEWRQTAKQIDELQAKIKAERQGKPLDISIDEMFYEMREERSEQMLQDFIFEEKAK